MNRKTKEESYPKAMWLKEYDPKFFRVLKRNKLALIDYYITSGNRRDALVKRLHELKLTNDVLVEENRRLKETIEFEADTIIDLLNLIKGVIFDGEE